MRLITVDSGRADRSRLSMLWTAPRPSVRLWAPPADRLYLHLDFLYSAPGDLNMRIGSSIVSSGMREAPRTDARFRQVTANQTGHSFPPGATVFVDGVNFSVFSRQASRVELLLFDVSAGVYPRLAAKARARPDPSYAYPDRALCRLPPAAS